ncbi:Branched-chain amino acid ABC transporter, amino acid-binding protein [Streptococcus sp. DD10]|uniref:ABC transporter substrate-binding protein n=1 Tax=Streptococcus sp. DD10 TaxID=1777878 RepID=UPI000791BAFB|nr:ABC transporter substrate-binding protein [Streptococcus sp. DD10]KXT74045.1 Branched-chain amino acid ABC transporter, amino acid-binding protein [Streptococcus sp. DD10]
MKKKIAFSMLTFASVAFLAACGEVSTGSSSTTGTSIGDTIKIGFNFEETGAVASYGISEQKGAQLAVDQINEAGGIDGKKIEVVDKDNKSETAEAATVSTNLVTQSQVNAIVGPATSGATAAAVANATKAGVPLISPSATQDGLTKGQEYLFIATFQDSFQGKIISNFVTNQLSAKKVVLYYDNSSDYAKGIAESFKSSYKGEIVSEQTFQSKDTDFQAALTKIKDQDFDAIVLPGYYTEAGKIVNQARGMGIDKPIVGGDGFNGEEFVQQATAERASNIYFISGFSTTVDVSEKAKSFLEAYRAKYNEEPSTFAALAYDSVNIVAQAAKGAKNSVELKDNIAKTKNFEGVTGDTSFDENHNTVKTAFMMTMNNGVVEAAETVQP